MGSSHQHQRSFIGQEMKDKADEKFEEIKGKASGHLEADDSMGWRPWKGTDFQDELMGSGPPHIMYNT